MTKIWVVRWSTNRRYFTSKDKADEFAKELEKAGQLLGVDSVYKPDSFEVDVE